MVKLDLEVEPPGTTKSFQLSPTYEFIEYIYYSLSYEDDFHSGNWTM